MHSFKRIFAVLSCSLALAACSHLESWFPTYEEEEEIGVYSADDYSVPDSEYTGSGAVAEHLTGGNVQVFSLDDPAPPPMNTRGPSAMGGRPSGSDPNVTVFPLDGGSSGYGAMPRMMPPSGARSAYPSPFPDQSSLVTPAPASYSGTGPAVVYFGHGSVSLDGSDRDTVRSFAQSRLYTPIRVDGHASTRTETSDPVESRIINLKISMDRALSVSRELIRGGVPAERIQTTAWGDTKPPVGGYSMDPEAASRRVEIAAY